MWKKEKESPWPQPVICRLCWHLIEEGQEKVTWPSGDYHKDCILHFFHKNHERKGEKK